MESVSFKINETSSITFNKPNEKLKISEMLDNEHRFVESKSDESYIIFKI